MSAMTPLPSSSVNWPSYWNERYLREPSRYGFEPNVFVVEAIGSFSPGRVLDAACGQGRNAVWLAARGHDVTAVDLSTVAIDRGRAFAAERGVDVAFHQADFLEWEPVGDPFDTVLLSYLQLPPGERRRAHHRAMAALADGGRLVVVAHHGDNLTHGFGGPEYPEVLYDEGMLAEDFADLTVERNERVIRTVVRAEGDTADAIDVVFVGRRGQQR